MFCVHMTKSDRDPSSSRWRRRLRPRPLLRRPHRRRLQPHRRRLHRRPRPTSRRRRRPRRPRPRTTARRRAKVRCAPHAPRAAAAGAAAMRRQVDHRGDGVHDAHHRALQHGPARAARGRDAAELPRAKAQLRPDAHHEEVLRRVLPRQARLPLVGRCRGVRDRSRVYSSRPSPRVRRPAGSATPRPRSRRPRRPSPRRSRS